jgi:hypothetical protein
MRVNPKLFVDADPTDVSVWPVASGNISATSIQLRDVMTAGAKGYSFQVCSNVRYWR